MDQKYLKSVLNYDPETGVFTWAAARPKVVVGRSAGSLHRKGYIYMEIDGKHYAAHRLAWFYMTGEMPSGPVDHINREKADNRFVNLRLATHGQNRANSKNTNKHGLKGVAHKPSLKSKPWVAEITIKGKSKHLGCFSTPEEANACYAHAARQAFGEFANP